MTLRRLSGMLFTYVSSIKPFAVSGPGLRALMLRILDPRAKIDYLYMFLVAALPTGLAYYLGAHKSYEFEGEIYLGYWVKTNFWPFMFLLPFMLWVVRRLFYRIAPISAATMTDVPPIIQLIKGAAAQKEAYMEMRHYLSSPLLLAAMIGLALMIQMADMAELMMVYFADQPIRPGETDWTVMFAAGVMSKAENMILVFFGYIVQFLAIWFQCLLTLFLLAHNFFFLGRVYQRSRVTPGQESHYIQVDLDDVNRCFGFRGANDAFNSQVVLLILYGVLALVTRFNNVYVEDAPLRFEDLMTWPLNLPQIDYFPDVGQWLVSSFWLLTLFTVSLPAVVKLLPRFSSGSKSVEMSITDYIKEFIPPDQWQLGDSPSQRSIDQLAAKFAQNAFWPTGNNRASQLFFFSSWVFLIILWPLQTADTELLVAVILILGVIAYCFRTLLISLLNASLSFVDERLTKERPELLDTPEEKPLKVEGNLFISYRRQDAGAYARLIQQSLVPFVDEQKIFMDLNAIHDGDDFVERITDAVLECDALFVIIGPDWASCTNSNGEPRIFQPKDFVRLEIETGLKHKRLVIPVLVGGATVPTEEQLPESLQPLLRRHARELSDSRWDYDISELVKTLVAKSDKS